MYPWLLIRRMRGPAFLILVGINALLNQWGVLSFKHSWPLYLILAGVLGLAERAALATATPVYPVNPAYPAQGFVPPAYSPAPPTTPFVQTAPAADPLKDPLADPVFDPDRRP